MLVFRGVNHLRNEPSFDRYILSGTGGHIMWRQFCQKPCDICAKNLKGKALAENTVEREQKVGRQGEATHLLRVYV